MENSMNSMGNSSFSQEESGWTIYFEDLLNNEKNNEQSCCADLNQISSIVSDAASSIANQQGFGLSLEKSSQNVSFIRKRKIKGSFVDDSLEDTASSPVHSPKACYLKKMNMNPSHKSNRGIPYKEEGRSSNNQQVDEKRRDIGFNGRESDLTELKKRGLCLVPLSMVVNYLG